MCSKMVDVSLLLRGEHLGPLSIIWDLSKIWFFANYNRFYDVEQIETNRGFLTNSYSCETLKYIICITQCSFSIHVALLFILFMIFPPTQTTNLILNTCGESMFVIFPNYNLNGHKPCPFIIHRSDMHYIYLFTKRMYVNYMYSVQNA